MSIELGPEIKKLRTEAGYTLRGFAQIIGISAAHQSDIEHGRRMPGEAVLHEMGRALASVGGAYEHLKTLDARINQDLQDWAQRTPEIAAMLRTVRDSGRSPREVLAELQQILADDAPSTGAAEPSAGSSPTERNDSR